ncbi:hypothetical protein [Saccharothrix sp. HUAS TT1]|uniref:hypothetical protein n=1 Tax=unclassified Saccharothrix TaxID=2593673 RepID=UPI00345BCB25
MTKPTSRLDWFPDPTDPLAVRAAWFGAGWHYTLEWGDGTRDRLLFWQPPRRHVYPAPGRYTAVATAELAHSKPVSMQVVLRPTLTPQAGFELIPDTTRVRATLEHHDEQVLYRVDWGDGRVSQHDVHDLAPEHEYLPGIGTPTITVVDVPARRTGRFTGPEIPDPPLPESGPRTEWRLTTPLGSGRLDLHGFPAHTTVELGRAGWGSGSTPPGTVVTDAHGRAARDYTLWPTNAPWLDDWQSIHVRWTDPDNGRFRQRWQPVQVCEWLGGPKHDDTVCQEPNPSQRNSPRNPCNELPLTVDWEIGSPQIVTLTCAPAVDGTWTVEWGDDVTDQVPVQRGGFFTATHDYGRLREVWPKVTDPRGRVGRRRLRQIRPKPRTWTDGSLAIFQEWEQHVADCAYLGYCDPYSVMRVDCGDGRPLAQVHRPSLVCPDRSGNGFSYAAPGSYLVTIHGPMSEPVTYTHVQKTKSGLGEAEFPIREPANPLTQTFHVGDVSKPDRYTAWFEITNSATEPVPWRLDFTLAAPARLADVRSWVGTASVTDLGGGKWRITCDTPARPRDPFRVEITVEPCGSPRVWPADIHLSPPG